MPADPTDAPTPSRRERRSHRAAAPALRVLPRPLRYAAGVASLAVVLVGTMSFAGTLDAAAPGDSDGGDLAGDGAALSGRDEMWAQASRGDARDPLQLEVEPVTFTVIVDGETVELTSGAATLADLLIEAGIEVDLDDEVSAPMGEAPADGAKITITRVGTQHGTDVEDIPFETVERETDDLPSGTTRVETEGVVGTRVTTYLAEHTDGAEVTRSEQLSVVVDQPVDEVVLIGTGPVVAAGSGSSGGTGDTTTGGSTATEESGSSEPEATTAEVPAYSGGDPRGIAQQMVAARGWDSSQWSCLDSLWQRESNWNPSAMNPSSGAYGIPQSLPGNKMASAGSDWQTNPATQIEWGLGYIAGRYGTPCGAWAHSESVGWY